MAARQTKPTAKPANSRQLLDKAQKAKGQKKAIYEVGAALVHQLSQLNAKLTKKPGNRP